MRSRYFLIISSLLGLIASGIIPQAQSQIAPEIESKPSELTRLEGPALDKAFRGKTVDGIYKVPRQRTGTNKFTESFNTDGTTKYFEGPLVDTGQWIALKAQVCFHYDGALAGNLSCFHVYQSGTCIYSYNPANIGPDGYPLDDNLWSAKTIARGDSSTCDDLIS